MQRYIAQLIEDLHKATWGMKPPHDIWEESLADPEDELEQEDMSYVEKYVYGDELPISEITGIALEQLPPGEKLSQEQQTLLAVELESLLKFFHFYLDFPLNYPNHLRYPFIRKFWEEKHVAISFGENHIEFCEYVEEECPFPEYCSCCRENREELEIEEQSENMKISEKEFDTNNLLLSPAEIEDWLKNQGIDDNDSDLNFQAGFAEGKDQGPGFVNGFFNDDGTRIDPESVPVPALCMVCKSYYEKDSEENFLCMMNRNDQRNDSSFICGTFEDL